MSPTPPSKSRVRRTAPDDDGQELLGRAERIVAVALARGADQAECYLERGASVGIELEAGRLGSTSAHQGQGAGLRIVKAGRLGFAYLTRDDDAARAADQALAQARHAPRRNFVLPPGRKAQPLRRWDGRIAQLDATDALQLAQEALRSSKAAVPKATVSGGGASLSVEWTALASSEGVAAVDRSTSAGVSVSLTLQDGERAIAAGEMATRHALGKLDAVAVADAAAATLLSLRKPKAPGASRACHIILQPEAAAELVAGLAVGAATGDDARRGKTVWSERLGKRVGSPLFTLVDDSRTAGAIGAVPFDGEGTPTRRMPIVEGGVLRNFLYDAWDAHRHDAKTTASATRGGFKSRPDTGTHHLVVESNKAQTRAKLIAGVDDGYLVDSVLGAHTANPTTGEFSVTAPNVWRIVDGEIAGPVTEIALAGSLDSLLAGLDGVAKTPKAMDGLRMPALRVANVNVST